MDRPTVGSVQILRGNALALALADESVDLIVTSPPYFGLRSYQDGGEHYAGQIGDEPTPAEFVDALIAATAEMVRVLKPSGSIWVNLGDKYAGSNGQPGGSGSSTLVGTTSHTRGMAASKKPATGAPTKSLIGIPWRYAIRCIDDLGLILRAEVIWSKPNGLPESVTDRVRRSHEQWFHFTKEPRYYSAVDEVREEHAARTIEQAKIDAKAGLVKKSQHRQPTVENRRERSVTPPPNPLGKLPGSVWDEGLGNSLVSDILEAVAAGAITPQEGERIWTSASDSWHTLTIPATAGNGPDTECQPGTGRQQSSERAERNSPTDSPTDSSSARSPMASPSTISAETPDASDRTTSNPSPSPKTSGEHTHPGPTARRGTASTTPTQSAPATATSAGGAGSATSPESTSAGGSVWRIATEPLRVPEHLGIDHFAAFPSELPRRIIQGWSPSGICTECGEGRRPVVASVRCIDGEPQQNLGARKVGGYQTEPRGIGNWRVTTERTHKGEECACPEPTAPTRPAVVLDPFGGTGTTALVAKALGRHGISNDMSADYCRLAGWRTTDPKQLAKAARRPFVPPAEQTEGQLDLLEGIA